MLVGRAGDDDDVWSVVELEVDLYVEVVLARRRVNSMVLSVGG